MALTKCRRCGGRVYDTTQTCPHCGTILNQKSSASQWLVIIAISLLGFSGYLFYQTYPSHSSFPPPSSMAPSAINGRLPDTVAKRHTTRENGEVLEVQLLLSDLGYPVGRPDGILGPKTREAIRAFQQKEGLTDDGEVSEHLLSQLRKAKEAKQGI
jgi:hypothetical protein